MVPSGILLEHKRFGPFEILEQTGPVNFKLKLYPPFNLHHEIFHANHLIPYHEDPNPERIKAPPPPVFLKHDDEEPQYKVDHLEKN